MKEVTGRWKVRKKKGGMKWVWKKRKVDHHLTLEDLIEERPTASGADR